MQFEEALDCFNQLLKEEEAITQNETVYDFLNKSYSEIEPICETIFSKRKTQHNKWIYFLFLLGITDILRNIKKTSQSPILQFNCDSLIEVTKQKEIETANPIFFSFFKWDLDRRGWKKQRQNFQINYLKKVISEISNELQGDSIYLLDKYVAIAFDFLIDFFEENLKKPEFIAELKTNEFLQKNNPFQVLLGLKKTKNNLNLYIDNELRESLRGVYYMVAESYKDGILNTEGRYNTVFIAFIDAQIEYQEFLEKQIELLQNTSNSDYIKLKYHIENLELEKFINGLKALFASVPNVLIKNTNEAYYHIYIHLILTLINCDYKSEVNTNLGRIDGVLETPTNINIIEFKLNSAEDGMSQILRKKYYQKYLDKDKKINLLSISFCQKEKNIKEYEIIYDFIK